MIVYEGDDEGTSVVAVKNPVVQLGPAGNPVLDELGREVREHMAQMLDGLERASE